MSVNPWDVLPPRMQRIVRETEAREANEAELARCAAEDEADARRIMATHQEHVFEAETGMSQSAWREAQQARVEALAASGFNPHGVIGSAERPEQLVGGGSLTPSSAQPAEARRAAYAQTSGIDALLSRSQAEAAAWNAPEIRRQRELSLRAEISREGGGLDEETRRVIRRHAPPVTSSAGGRALPYQEWPPHLGAPRLDPGDW